MNEMEKVKVERQGGRERERLSEMVRREGASEMGGVGCGIQRRERRGWKK